MGYRAYVVNILIASPSDVSQERQIARIVINDWNSVHSKDKKTVLMPVGWETHSVPDTGSRPQAIINGQLLKEADLLVAIFWTRIGSPTGVAPSGTVEEIEEHLKAGKPAMVYFSSAPAHPDSIDEKQYSALKEFKRSLSDRGLYQEYESLGDFKDKFTRHLAQKIISGFTQDSEIEIPGDVRSVPTVNFPITTTIHGTVARLPKSEIGRHATELLIEASRDPQGVIMSLMTMQGASVQTNGRDFVEGGPRSEAQWRGAVGELAQLGMVEDRGGKGEVYFVTNEGYRAAEALATK